MINDGDKAPDLTLQVADGKPVRIARAKGKALVLYFYPKDDTPGCTTEAKDFSCLAGEFEGAGAEVLGISPDDAESHRKFIAKHDLKVRLAADTGKEAAQAFGVWVEKSMYGRKYMGVERATFLIDTSGMVVRSWRKVKVPKHAEEVLAAVKAMGR